MTATKVRKLKIAGLPKERDYNAMPWGRQLEYRKAIEAFKATAKVTHLSQKRQTYAKAIREAIDLLGAAEYYCEFHCSPTCKDDSFEFWYR